MINPERERRRLEAAQAAALATADAGMKHPGADMVRVWSVAGFELADVFEEWHLRSQAACLPFLTDESNVEDFGDAIHDPETMAAVCDGLGPCWPLHTEKAAKFGERVALAILQLIKEV